MLTRRQFIKAIASAGTLALVPFQKAAPIVGVDWAAADSYSAIAFDPPLAFGDRFYTGTIQAMRVYDRVLTDAEIAQATQEMLARC